jgi:Cdc6-like AAA superfamily ATPase|tara:strand:- start:5162 stop:6595 length:1434 start_codon:yes stop_codon:yes gene_type:complete
MDQWVPIGHELFGGATIRRLVSQGAGWQIYVTSKPSRVLFATQELASTWFDANLIVPDLFTKIEIGKKLLLLLDSPPHVRLEPVLPPNQPDSKAEAYAFAAALQQTRDIDPGIDVANAIFVEQYSRLLPTADQAPSMPDDILLGSWLTGGVEVSCNEFRALAGLTSWMKAPDLADIIRASGMSAPAELRLVTTREAEETSVAAMANKPAATENKPPFSLPGRPYLEQFFRDHIIDIVENSEKYAAMGISFPSGVILHGPPGCGKTFAVDELADYLGWPRYAVDSSSIGSPYIHETSKKIGETFDSAIQHAPSIIVIDEMEAFLTDRQSAGSHGTHRVEEVAEFLRKIPEAIDNHVLVVAMTNLIDIIDPAILRRGRFDHVIEVSMPSEEEVQLLLTSLVERLPLVKGISLETMARALAGRPLSDAAFSIREASRLAARDRKEQIDQECIDTAMVSIERKEQKQSPPIGFVWDDQEIR